MAVGLLRPFLLAASGEVAAPVSRPGWQKHGSRRPVAEPAQRAQPKAFDRPLVRDSSGAAKGGVAGPDPSARGLLQLRGAGGAEPRGAGERRALCRRALPSARVRPGESQRLEEVAERPVYVLK